MSTDYSETALYEAVRRLDNDTRRNVGRQMTHLYEAWRTTGGQAHARRGQ